MAAPALDLRTARLPVGGLDGFSLDTWTTTPGKITRHSARRHRPPREKNAVLQTFLAAEGPSRGRWAYHKHHADRLADKLERAGLGDRAQQMRACGDVLVYRVDGGLLGPDYRCGQRLCPMCQGRRATRWSHRVRDALPELATARGHWVLLTLTMRSVPIEETRAGIRKLHRAVDRLAKRREWAARGWARQTETTVNPSARTVHPHVHLLLFLPADYYRTPARWIRKGGKGRPTIEPGYMSVKRMRKLWAHALGADYDPWLDFTPVTMSDPNQRAGAIAEICKYGQKPAELTALSPDDLRILAGELAGHRTFSVCGEMRRFIPALNRHRQQLEKMIREGRAPGPVDRVPEFGLVARWDPSARRYDLFLPANGERDAHPGRSPTLYRDRLSAQLASAGAAQSSAPLAPPEWVGDVYSEPENTPLDDRAERRRLAELQARRPDLYRNKRRE